MVSASFLSYLLPLSLLQSGPALQPRPTPSSSRTSLGLPLLRTLRSRPNTSFALSLEDVQVPDRTTNGVHLVALDPTSSSVQDDGGFQEQRDSEAVPLIESDEPDDLEWYYEAADEVELRQEQDLWKWLLQELSAGSTDKTKVAELFKELLVDEVTVERGKLKPGRAPSQSWNDPTDP
ncbi:hypothetical protein JCM11491_005389 [Sporobolomyces phaffii]